MTPGHKLAALLAAIAVPTAIAAWDKLRSHPSGDDGGSLLGMIDESPTSALGLDPLDDRPDELSRYAEAQRATAAAQQAAARLQHDTDVAARRDAALAALCDPRTLGAPGALFAHLDLAHPGVVSDAAQADFDGFQRDAGGLVTATDERLTVDLSSPDGVRAAIERAWASADGDRWRDPRHHLRASYTEDALGAHLVWERTTTIDELIAPDHPDGLGFESSPLVGQRLAAAYLPVPLDVDGRSFTLPPLGWSATPVGVDLDLDARSGTITAMHVHTQDPADADDVLAALAAKYGAPLRDDGDLRTWRRGPLSIRASRAPEGVVIDVSRARR